MYISFLDKKDSIWSLLLGMGVVLNSVFKYLKSVTHEVIYRSTISISLLLIHIAKSFPLSKILNKTIFQIDLLEHYYLKNLFC